MKTDIVLIGPPFAGQNHPGTVGLRKVGPAACIAGSSSLGLLRRNRLQQRDPGSHSRKGGLPGRIPATGKPFEAHAVERLLADHQDCVIDFGAGHTVYEDETLFARVEAALQPYANVVLLLPSPDLEESVRILRTREDWDGMADGFDFQEHYVKHPSNYRLAKHTVYTKGKTPAETCDEIIAVTGKQP